MFGPSYFNQVGWIGDGDIIAEDELEGLDEIRAEWDNLVEAAERAFNEDHPNRPWAFDRQRDIVRDGQPITFDELVEETTGYRPLMEAEVDEIESESAYQQAQELKRETLDALVENHPSIAVAVADVLNEYVLNIEDEVTPEMVALRKLIEDAVEKAIDNLDVADLGAQLLSDVSGKPING